MDDVGSWAPSFPALPALWQVVLLSWVVVRVTMYKVPRLADLQHEVTRRALNNSLTQFVVQAFTSRKKKFFFLNWGHGALELVTGSPKEVIK